MTSGRSAGPQQPGLFGSSVLVAPVNPPAVPGSSEARKMTAGSGARLSEFFPKSGPLGRCSKILLELETWTSPEYFLKWRLRGTKQGCSVFQLAPSAPRTAENATGSSAAGWKTPTANEDAAGRWKPKLAMQEMLAHQVKGTWPTPRVTTSNMTPSKTQASRVLSGEESLTGAGACKLELTLETAMVATWPTPTQRAGKDVSGNNACRSLTKSTRTDKLTHVVATWATPKAAQAHGPISCGCLARTEKFVVRLTTLSAWLMGYTGAYLGHWEIASSRKSRKKS